MFCCCLYRCEFLVLLFGWRGCYFVGGVFVVVVGLFWLVGVSCLLGTLDDFVITRVVAWWFSCLVIFV